MEKGGLVARKKLQARKTVDSSESLPLSNLKHPPVLTTCPQTDYDETILDKSGYDLIQFLIGIFTI